MKRWIAVWVLTIWMLGALIPPMSYAETKKIDQEEIRAVWMSYYEMDTMLKGRSESEFRANFEKALEAMKSDGMNTVMVQVRPFGDALYKSKLYPSSYLITGKEGDALTFDPLEVMIKSTKSKGMKIEAWMNPYRVRINVIKAPISQGNVAAKWLSDGSDRVVKISSGIFYNPSDSRVNDLFVSGVKELVSHYQVDGVHLDDYFYPTTATSFDRKAYGAYQKKGGKLKLEDFRREQINQMVKSVYQVCHSEGRNIKFGISPQGIMKNNYDGQYADVEKWVTNKGYVDYICPQIYYGYQNETAGYAKILDSWQTLSQKSKVDFYVGLAAYKIGLDDKWAKAGRHEWENETGMLSKMILDARTLSRYKGIVLFRYDSLWNPSKSVREKVEQERLLMRALWAE